MLIVLCVLFLVLCLIFTYTDHEGLSAISFWIFIIFLVTTVIVWMGVIDGAVIDEKIAMYQEENARIEEDIDALVQQYMDYETETFGQLKGDSSITLVALYPELKADNLVIKQTEIYLANNEKIKSLKESKINLRAKKWWLYFGH